jgi:hypothetical protein
MADRNYLTTTVQNYEVYFNFSVSSDTVSYGWGLKNETELGRWVLGKFTQGLRLDSHATVFFFSRLKLHMIFPRKNRKDPSFHTSHNDNESLTIVTICR